MIDQESIHYIFGMQKRKEERKGSTESIHLSQRKYTEELIAKFEMTDDKTISTSLVPSLFLPKLQKIA